MPLESTPQTNLTAEVNSKVLYRFAVLCGLVVLIAPWLYVWPAVLGDAAIYFVFLQNFFELPYSFNQDTVNYGATSPLHVLVQAFVYQVAGDLWFVAIKTSGAVLIAGGSWLLFRGIDPNKEHTAAWLLVCSITGSFVTLHITAAQGFETPLTYFMVCLCIYFYLNNELCKLILAAGLLPLCRPELLFISAAIAIYAFARMPNKTRVFTYLAASSIPGLSYWLYMIVNGAGYIPSSVYARALRSMEANINWQEKFNQTLIYLHQDSPVLLAMMTLCLFAFMPRFNLAKLAGIFFLPLIGLFLVFPPQAYVVRYLTPALPAIVTILALVTIKSALSTRAISALSVLLLSISLLQYSSDSQDYAKYDLDTWLLRDLSEHLNLVATANDRVLIYEVQSQYYLDAQVFSIDGIIQSEIYNALTGRQDLEDFILENRIDYVVTMNAFNYRPIFKQTFLPELYAFDLNANIGDSYLSNKLKFEKLLTNPDFSDTRMFSEIKWDGALNIGKTLRVYSANKAGWSNHQILWNSVYKVDPLPSNQ